MSNNYQNGSLLTTTLQHCFHWYKHVPAQLVLLPRFLTRKENDIIENWSFNHLYFNLFHFWDSFDVGNFGRKKGTVTSENFIWKSNLQNAVCFRMTKTKFQNLPLVLFEFNDGHQNYSAGIATLSSICKPHIPIGFQECVVMINSFIISKTELLVQ